MRLLEMIELAEKADRFCKQIFAVWGCEDGLEGYTWLEIVNMTDYCMHKGHFGLKLRFDAQDEKTVVAMLVDENGVRG